MRFIGIDPGLGGAMAVIDMDDRSQAVTNAWAFDMPVATVRRGQTMRREYDLRAMHLLLVQHSTTQTLVAIEHILPMPVKTPGEDGGFRGSIGAFHIGRGLGLWEGLCAALCIPYVKVLPTVWKRRYGLLGQGKQASRLKAQERFPTAELHLKKHDGRADALWLALYADEFHRLAIPAAQPVVDLDPAGRKARR